MPSSSDKTVASVQRSADGWLVTFHPRPAARVRLFCFPYAGAGASVFNPWRNCLSPEIELTAVQLPGREDRLREPLPRRIRDLTSRLLPILAPRLDRPYALLGYSLGALIAFDLALRIEAGESGRPIRPPDHLFALARLAPQLKDPAPPFYHWPQVEFVDELQRRYGALPPVLLQEPELLQVYLPIVRADLEMVDTYERPKEGSLACPITAIGGAQDVWRPADIAAWQEATTGRFEHLTLPGDHFFLRDSRDALCGILNERLGNS
jgi:medium-chain acyl-[acyl-carrier-protein] hydrolase